MINILYAASDLENSKIQLSRFLKASENKAYNIKIAAFKKSAPKNVHIDWTLDALLDFFKPNTWSLENPNFHIYYEQVKSFKPDLIISDMEYFTSYVANTLNIPLWQCSSSLINYGILKGKKYNLGLWGKYSFIIQQNALNRQQRDRYIIENSNKIFIYSHFGDLFPSPELNKNFEWIRPYHSIGKVSIPCEHNIVAGMLANDKKIFSLLNKYKDSVAFSEFELENYENILLKSMTNQEEYFCNLRNSNLFLCQGQTSFLADAFYNNKYSIVIPNFKDNECITNAIYSEHFKLSSNIYDIKSNIEKYYKYIITSQYNNKIAFLHQKVDEFIK